MAISRRFLVLVLCLCCCVVMQTRVLGGEVTDNLSNDQIRRIFHRSRDELPNFKTVKLQTLPVHRSKRDLRPAEFEFDGEKTKLNLKPIENNVIREKVPVWTVKTDNSADGHSYEEEEINFDGLFYEDPVNMATLLGYYKDGYIHYDGVFGEGHKTRVVRSMKEKWYQEPGKKAEDNHVIYDANEEQGKSEPLGGSGVPSDAEKLDTTLDVMYPKILVVVTYDYFKALGEDVSETYKYVATLWNAVNLKYNKLTSPQIKLVVTGIIIAKDETALRFFHDNIYEEKNRNFEHIDMLMAQSDYFLKKFPTKVNFKNYDVTMTMTTMSNGGVVGSAYVGNICKKEFNVGFASDDASFSGLLSTTHELGHLLNLQHDGVGSAKACEDYPGDGVSTVMARLASDAGEFVWSKCSKQTLKNFAQMKAAECMRNPVKA